MDSATSTNCLNFVEHVIRTAVDSGDLSTQEVAAFTRLLGWIDAARKDNRRVKMAAARLNKMAKRYQRAVRKIGV